MLDHLTIFGAGLIGGSIALGARERGLARRVTAVNQDGGARLSGPERARFADRWVRADDEQSLAAVYAESSLVVLTSPVHSIIRELPRALRHAEAVTDAGSTKLSIAEAAAREPRAGHFVPGHPMAGHPTGGLGNARSDLFVDRTWLLCGQAAAPHALERVTTLALGLGARVVPIDSREHDRAVALTSHVPQLLASALAALGSESNAELAAGPGFASATRVAGGAEAIWGDIFATNAAAIAETLAALEAELQAVRNGLLRGDTGAALALLARARQARQKSD